MAMQRTSPIPLYYQLAEMIREHIDSGRLQPDDQLPSERELSERYGISRMTARQALTYLVNQNRLVARPGIGTFVADPKLTHNARHLLGFTEEMLSHGQEATSQVLEQIVLKPSEIIAAQLQLGPDEKAIKIVRLRFSQNVPLLLETVFIPHAVAPGLENENLQSSPLYSLLEGRYGQYIDHSHQTLELVTATEEEAQLFAISKNSNLLLLQGLTFDANDRPVEFFKAVYRGDKFKFTLESRRHQRVDETAKTSQIGLILREHG